MAFVKLTEVAQASNLQRGILHAGSSGTRLFDTKQVLFGRSKIPGSVRLGWHHHGRRHFYGFVVSGSLQFDYGENGKDSIRVESGDFFHISAGVVHRDVNPDRAREAEVLHILVGTGPTTINVAKP
jgi:uncharacterized RmlC-like cupin family protein